MDEKKLKEILQNTDAPAPNEEARKSALNAAMAEFDKKDQKTFQGNTKQDRPIGMFNNLWRLLMKKRFVITGVTGAVAACAVLVLISFPLFSYEAGMEGKNMQRADTGFANATANISQPARQSLLDKWRRQNKETGDVDPEYREALESANRQRADEARRSGTSSLPTPIGSSDARIQAPKLNNLEGTNPLEAWRRRSDAVNVGRSVASPRPDIVQNQYSAKGRDDFAAFQDNATKRVSEKPVSTFSIDVDTSSYSFVRRMINNGRLPQKDAVRVEELINYFDYDYKLPESTETPFKPNIAVYDSPWAKDKKLLHIGIKGYELTQDQKPASNLTFLIDTSGSMNSQDKLPLLINSFKLLLDTLDEKDTISIVTYAGSAGTVMNSIKADNRHTIQNALNNLRAGGSTAGGAGIKQAYSLAESNFIKGGVNRVILATDGDFNVGITNQDELQGFVEHKRESGVSLSILGFGHGNYNDSLMQALAQNGNGNAAYIDSLSEARKVLVEEAGSTLFTIAQDVKIQVEFNPELVAEYRLIGYETRQLKREDFNNDKVDAGEIGAGHAVTAIYEITPVGSENRSVENLRYQKEVQQQPEKAEQEFSNEYAQLKIRYKLPEEGLGTFSDTSKLLTRTITTQDESDISEFSDDIRFAAAVAGFGQILRGGHYTGDFSFDDVINIAMESRGEDRFGYRTEFINLVRLAKSAKEM
jgi:Ca-activated chloride channel family protein